MKRPKMQYFFDILRWRFFLRFLTIFGAFRGGKIWTHWKDGACGSVMIELTSPYFAREVIEQTSPDQHVIYSKRDAWACRSTPIDIYPLKSLHMFRLHPVNLMYRVFTKMFLCQWLSCSSSTYNSKSLQRLSSRKKILNLWRSFSRLVRPRPIVMGLWSSVSCWHKNLHFIAGLSLPLSCFISI